LALIYYDGIRRLSQYSTIGSKQLAIALDYLCPCCVHRHVGASILRQIDGADRTMVYSHHGFLHRRVIT